jgi:DNA-binding NarL/FixJ family response regulator
MEPCLDVLIVSGSPIFARALERLLHDAPFPCRGEIETGDQLWDRASAHESAVLLLAPRSWEELSPWLPAWRHGLSDRRCLLLAEPRLLGMYLPQLEGGLCHFVPPSAPPDALWAALQALAHRRKRSLRHELLAHYSPVRLTRSPDGRMRLPTSAELRCGCAVSLGLRNRQIAQQLHLAEATVKSHVHRLLRKLELSDRAELGGYLRSALTPLAAPPKWK